jgi:uncharacterized protein (DUF488 family)
MAAGFVIQDMKPTLYTIGHSTRALDEFLELLKIHGIGTLVDVRTIPKSRRMPHFSQEPLRKSLKKAGLNYVHLPSLGGLRKPRKDSGNMAWRNSAFRGYADYMGTEEFEEGLAELNAITKAGPTAIMCAEAVPWRCHRSLISDILAARGVQVLHITGKGKPSPHKMTAFARVSGSGKKAKVDYPLPDEGQLELGF